MRAGVGVMIGPMEARAHCPISAPFLFGPAVVVQADDAAIPALPGIVAQERSDSGLPETSPADPAEVRTTTFTTLHAGIL